MLKTLFLQLETTLPVMVYRQCLRYKWFVFLMLLVWFNAATIAVLTHKVRNQTALLEQLKYEQYQLNMEWESLRLEQGALAEYNRISVLAKDRLKMKSVARNDEKVLEVD